MPESWSKKDERQYEHVKKSEKERGRRTERETTSGTGNADQPLEERTVEELRNRAEELDIEGRSDMDKDELVSAIRRRS